MQVKLFENIEERKAIQNIGIGTPATRAAIIETPLRETISRELENHWKTNRKGNAGLRTGQKS